MAKVIKVNSKKAIITLSKEDIAEHDLARWMRLDSKGLYHNSFIEYQPFEDIAGKLFKEEYPSDQVKVAESFVPRSDGTVDIFLRIGESFSKGYYNTEPTKLVFTYPKETLLNVDVTLDKELNKSAAKDEDDDEEDEGDHKDIDKDIKEDVEDIEEDEKEDPKDEKDIEEDKEDLKEDLEEKDEKENKDDDEEKESPEEDSTEDMDGEGEEEILEEIIEYLEDIDPEDMTKKIPLDKLQEIKEMLGISDGDPEEALEDSNDECMDDQYEECVMDGRNPLEEEQFKEVPMTDIHPVEPMVIELGSMKDSPFDSDNFMDEHFNEEKEIHGPEVIKNIMEEIRNGR
jgi:hypothetical protein